MTGIIPHQHMDRKLVFRLSIFLLIALIILGIVVYDVAIGYLAWWMAALSFLAGTAAGYVLGRILTVRWHETEQKAVMEMDVAGFVAIGIYIGLRFGENWLFGYFLSGTALSTLSLAFLAGALFGRFLGLRKSVVKVVRENVEP